MQFSHFLLSFSFLVFPIFAQTNPLKPWEISHLSTFSPSGRPGSSMYNILNLTITDPNTLPAAHTPTGTAVFPPSTAICNTSWVSGNEPYNQVLNCTAIDYGYWTFEILEANTTDYHSGTQNFDVKITLVDSVRVPGEDAKQVFTGRAHFEVGQNMKGLCAASGFCSWGLKEELSPWLVNQKRESCTGICE